MDAMRHTVSDSMRITVHARTPGGRPIELANTPIILTTTFSSMTEDITFVMSRDINPSESSVHLIMGAEGGLGRIQWQSG
jgi:hypothetical protein